MPYDNEIALWGNDKRENDKHPTHRGQAKVAGVEYWASGWTRSPTDKSNSPAIRIQLKPKDEAPAKATDEPQDFDDEIPF